jgi:hypothetical protein
VQLQYLDCTKALVPTTLAALPNPVPLTHLNMEEDDVETTSAFTAAGGRAVSYRVTTSSIKH